MCLPEDGAHGRQTTSARPHQMPDSGCHKLGWCHQHPSHHIITQLKWDPHPLPTQATPVSRERKLYILPHTNVCPLAQLNQLQSCKQKANPPHTRASQKSENRFKNDPEAFCFPLNSPPEALMDPSEMGAALWGSQAAPKSCSNADGLVVCHQTSL